MNTPVRRTVASRPAPSTSYAIKTRNMLRLATGPGYSLSAVRESTLKHATR